MTASAPSVRQRPTTPDSARQRRQARRGRLDVRIGVAGLDRVDELAAGVGVDRSEMARRLLAYAVVHMPPGWHPGRPSTVPAPSTRIGGRR